MSNGDLESTGTAATAQSIRKTVERAFALYGRGELAAAQALCQDVLKIEPSQLDALRLLAVVAAQAGNANKALELFREVLKIVPSDALSHCLKGRAHERLKQLPEALDGYERAIAINAQFVEAHVDRGNVLAALGRQREALVSYDRAIRIRPDFALAYGNRGNALRELGEFDAALESFNRAIAIDSNFAEAYANRGVVMKELRQYAAALADYDRAIEIRADYAEAHYNRGNTLREMNRAAAAIESYDTAVALHPRYAEAFLNRGNVLLESRRFEEAAASFELAFALNPDFRCLFGLRLYAKMQTCDWEGLESELAELTTQIERGQAAISPFYFMAMSESASLQRKVAEIWVREECPGIAGPTGIPKRPSSGKIRVGYFSADFRNHPVAFLTAGLFETHDRSRFEITAFSFGPDTQDPMRRRLESAFDRFIEVRHKADREIALLARDMNLDIAVDLTGFTLGSRPRIFASRAAPVQVSYIGYLGTMAAPYMDYLVADPTIIPVDDQRHYAEKILYLPSYQVNDSKRSIAEHLFTRAELGLPPHGFVYCCFNSNYKLNPATFAGWMRILSRVPGSALFLFADSEAARDNLRREALKRGVHDHRLVFGEALSSALHVARHRAADLFLDTLPYNAGATASDALWSGLPVLTRVGTTFAGRTAASLLAAIELPELITTTQEQYEDLAVALASDPRRLAIIKQKLADNRLRTALFDTRLFTQRLEAGYSVIHARHQAGLPAEHIRVPPDRASAS